MKSYTLLALLISATASFSGFSQETNPDILSKKLKNARLAVTEQNTDGLVFHSYHVEEKINSKFGSQITTFEVSSFDLIPTNNLGPNNSRTVTVRFRGAKTKQTTAVLVPPTDVVTSR